MASNSKYLQRHQYILEIFTLALPLTKWVNISLDLQEKLKFDINAVLDFM